MAAHQTMMQWFDQNWLWVIFWVWIFGGFSWYLSAYPSVRSCPSACPRA